MKLRSNSTIGPSSLLKIGLLAVIFLVGCAPAATPTPAQPTVTTTKSPVAPSPLPTETLPALAATETLPTETPIEVPQPVATSRGPNLEATNPATVSLTSGDLQLVEFFRYT